MTDHDLVVAIRKIIVERVRLKGSDKQSAEARDLARYDRIVGLVKRHDGGLIDDDDVTNALIGLKQ